MKRILITGENSYIGTSFQEWLAQYPKEYEVEAISVRGENWKETDFSKFDVVYHVAGIAHIKETKDNEKLYYQVNRDLAIDVAKKSKNEGIKQFVFLSSMSIYGVAEGVITKETPLNPKTAYGKSKLEAEKLIQELDCATFKVMIVRPPMVYGKNCTGNYSKLSKLAKISFIFPKINNQRSMIYIDNLSYFIEGCIRTDTRGVLLPQNNKYVNTSEMVAEIAKANNKKIYLINGIGWLIKGLSKKSTVISKVFGTLIYDENITFFDHESQLNDVREISFIDSIKESEK